jgi:MFS transporter, DHA2 family, methylenomycin A resistance protein
VLVGFAMAAAAGALFVAQERRARQPMLPLSLFGHRMFALTSLIGLLVNIAIYGLIFVLSLYFQDINGLSAFQTGLAFVPMMAVVLPVNLVAPRVTERIGAPATIAVGAIISALGCLALLGIRPDTSYAAICAQTLAMSSGLGLLVPPLTSSLLGSVDRSRSGIAAGVLNATRQTGSVLGVALFGSLVGGTGTFMTGLHASLIISAVVLLAAAAASWFGAPLAPSDGCAALRPALAASFAGSVSRHDRRAQSGATAGR